MHEEFWILYIHFHWVSGLEQGLSQISNMVFEQKDIHMIIMAGCVWHTIESMCQTCIHKPKAWLWKNNDFVCPLPSLLSEITNHQGFTSMWFVSIV
jgi:hypothetical protein